MRRALVLLLVTTAVVPAGAAHACDTQQVDTLDVALPAKPATVAPGRSMTLPLRITRAGQPAAEIDVFATLNGRDFAAYKGGTTAADGTATLVLQVPGSARGPLELDVEAYRTVLNLPCAGVEEHDRHNHPWGRAG